MSESGYVLRWQDFRGYSKTLNDKLPAVHTEAFQTISDATKRKTQLQKISSDVVACVTKKTPPIVRRRRATLATPKWPVARKKFTP